MATAKSRAGTSCTELTTDRGDLLIVGSFGVWHGNDNTARKVELRKIEISAEQRKR